MTLEAAVPGLRVYKFGGASVQDAAGLLNLVQVVRATAEGQPLLVVVSAMGKTTNALEDLVERAYHGRDYLDALARLEATHQAAAQALAGHLRPHTQADVQEMLNDTFGELGEKLASLHSGLNYDEQYDQVVSVGELLASQLVALVLGDSRPTQWLDCRPLLRTDATWREGRVQWVVTESNVRTAVPPLLAAPAAAVVTQGFVGGTTRGRTTTLGREGSDYSAAIFAYCLGAESVTIWKDVPGLLNADPKLFADTVLYPEISYQETIEMAYYGASVIHPKTLQPLAERRIPLYVKSFLNPAAPGTLIHDCRHPALAPAFIRKTGQCLLSFASKDFAFISEENLAGIFGALATARLKINVMQSSAISFSVGTDYHEGRVRQLLTALGGQFRIQYNAGLSLFTIKNYDEASIAQLTAGRALLLEQRTRSTFQFLVRE